MSTLEGEMTLKEKDIEELHKKWNRQTNIITVLIAVSMGLSIFLVWILLTIFLPSG